MHALRTSINRSSRAASALSAVPTLSAGLGHSERFGCAAVSAAAHARLALPCNSRSACTLAPSAAAPRGSGVGILAMETYFPRRFVEQTDLEVADGVSAGKYTTGLGQSRMAFLDDREDINSIAMNAVARLLKNYNIDPRSVGRVEVGTETLVDKSKSTKTTLMQLFDGNVDIEGVTTINACYGGTAALLNTAAWVESSEWDGRYGIVVAADIAIYDEKSARPTGGVAAVACLVGPDAPLALVPKTRSTHSSDVFDFYKPRMMSEYPSVDGQLSRVCYLRAVDDCYNGSMRKIQARVGEPSLVTVDKAFDYFVFHSPYNKLVQQSFARIQYNDVRRALEARADVPRHLEALVPYGTLNRDESYSHRGLDGALKDLDPSLYNAMVSPSTHFSKSVGNSYTAAAFANLLCLVSEKGSALAGSRVGVFSYGSGAIATLYALQANKGVEAFNGGFSLQRIADTVSLRSRLDARQRSSVDEFAAALKLREGSYGKPSFEPVGSLDNIEPGSFYLQRVTDKHHRVYATA